MFTLPAAALGLVLVPAYFARRESAPKPPAVIDGKWVGAVVWNDASGRPYAQKFKTALFFLPHGDAGIVISFPTGAIGGAGTYTRQGDTLSVTCRSLSINGRLLPIETFSHEPWYRATAAYTVAGDGAHLTLTPAGSKKPTPAPCWPPLVSPGPITLGRVAPPDEPGSSAAPRE